jgi:tRNA threonylcarbamoyladenosine biosynthesis protein TsaE
LVVYLSGDLGAGKTTLVRGFLRAKGFTGSVKSPTYTLVESYNLTDSTVVHLDLYRLREPSELDALGLRDMDRPGHIWLIEWPERGEGRLPPADLSITLEVEPGAHVLNAVSHSQAGAKWLTRVSLLPD